MFEWLKSFLGNDWTIAIIGAVLSGIILVPITYKMTQILEKGKINKEVRLANSEILAILSRIISEGSLSNIEYIEIVIQSVSRKNGLDFNLINTPQMFIEDLILDIYKTNYLSMEKKNELVEKLNGLLKENNLTERMVKKETLSKNEKRLIIFIAFGSFTMISGLIYLTTFVLKEPPKSENDKSTIFALIVLVLAIAYYLFFSKRRIDWYDFFGIYIEKEDEDTKN